jgi:hypothetical protein
MIKAGAAPATVSESASPHQATVLIFAWEGADSGWSQTNVTHVMLNPAVRESGDRPSAYNMFCIAEGDRRAASWNVSFRPHCLFPFVFVFACSSHDLSLATVHGCCMLPTF